MLLFVCSPLSRSRLCGAVVYFDQLLGAGHTRKLVELLFYSRFQLKGLIGALKWTKKVEHT